MGHKHKGDAYLLLKHPEFNLHLFAQLLVEGTKRLIQIPAGGFSATSAKAYPRSKQLYTDLLKEAALCRNRGGEALAGLWGNLMVYGTVPGVNPCGNSALAYYTQGL